MLKEPQERVLNRVTNRGYFLLGLNILTVLCLFAYYFAPIVIGSEGYSALFVGAILLICYASLSQGKHLVEVGFYVSMYGINWLISDGMNPSLNAAMWILIPLALLILCFKVVSFWVSKRKNST